uniref:Cytochrome P450 family 26 subfamily C member 1 n=1 Tax=Pelusios castaneus TaxID=367368 RepID=A0A8C8R9K3_9SAUR
MLPVGIGALSWLGAAATALLSLGLLLAATRHLWTLRWTLSRDRGSALPLPKGSMGWPFLGETLHWLVQVRFHSSRRERYGAVFKTHLLGKPVIRVSGAENVRRILLGEHSLVSTEWPQSTHILLGSNTLLGSAGELHRHRRKVIFSRAALESYIPGIQKVVKWELRGWCRAPGPITVYSSAKTLTFRIAARILLGLSLEEKQFKDLAKTFEQLVENLFSLPLNVPFSGLRKGIKARDMLHDYMEKAIMEKLQRKNMEGHSDALDFIINSAKEHGKEFTIQELKEPASTSLTPDPNSVTTNPHYSDHGPGGSNHAPSRLEVPTGAVPPGSECECQPEMNLEKLSRLRYLDCVIKEVLRVLPPVSGGYRTALQTFELDGYQIPKGWSVMYSIRDTHETAAVYQSAPESFDPDRFGAARQEDSQGAGRFHYIPFGGGVRSCIGQELAKAVLKLLAIELVRTARWELATPDFPAMQTVPIVHPVDGLQLFFRPLQPGGVGPSSQVPQEA